MGKQMLSIFTSIMYFQSTSNDQLEPVMTAGLVNMHIDWSIANFDTRSSYYHNNVYIYIKYLGQNFFISCFWEKIFRFRAGGTKKINKKALKMTS